MGSFRIISIITPSFFRILVPLYDPDTNMCFLCGKGDRTMQFIEVRAHQRIDVNVSGYIKHVGTSDILVNLCKIPLMF